MGSNQRPADAVTGAYMGVQPRVLLATGFSDQQSIVVELLGIAEVQKRYRKAKTSDITTFLMVRSTPKKGCLR
ncbi:MAG: hypothetical protein Q9M22_07040 [Mariprofundaceae bacterium]|nr:hypothetical protein [Mariprofundaceae bacterium]